MIVGIAGGAGSGKSTAANYLYRTYGTPVLAFARSLKDLLREAFDLSEEQLYGTQAMKEAVDPRYNLSPRELMTRVGQAAREVWDVDFWARRTVEHARRAERGDHVIVIEDVRHENEARAILDAGGVVWRLHPPPEGATTSVDGTHPSEAGWRSLPATREVRPDRRGLVILYRALDEAWLSLETK